MNKKWLWYTIIINRKQGGQVKLSKITKEEQKEITQKLKKVKLNLDEIPDIFKVDKKVEYKPYQEYDNTNYKVYRYVDIKSIEI